MSPGNTARQKVQISQITRPIFVERPTYTPGQRWAVVAASVRFLAGQPAGPTSCPEPLRAYRGALPGVCCCRGVAPLVGVLLPRQNAARPRQRALEDNPKTQSATDDKSRYTLSRKPDNHCLGIHIIQPETLPKSEYSKYHL